MNFHFDVFCRMGYEGEAHKIQDLYLDGHQADAIAAVPTSMVEEICLIGPVAKIRDDLELWKSSMVTTHAHQRLARPAAHDGRAGSLNPAS